MKASKRKVSKRTDRKVAQYGRNAAAMLELAKGKARHWTIYSAAVASGFTMATTAEATLLVGTPAAGTVIAVGGSLRLNNAANSDMGGFARIAFPTSSSVVFSALGSTGRGFLGTQAALDTFSASDEVSLTDPEVGTIRFNSATPDLPTAGIIGFRTANSVNAVTGLLDFTIDFNALTVTINNFWYDEDASDGTAHIALPDPPVSGAAVPEPVSLGLLALGAAGIAAMRRRRQHSAPATS